MLPFRRPSLQSCLALVLLLQALPSCTIEVTKPARNPTDHVFLRYWPAPEGYQGLKVAVKDFIDIEGQVTSAGSAYLAKNNPPASKDAACLRGVRAQGAHIVGKTNASEFGVTSSGLNPHFGTPRSPLTDRKHRLISGGSSSGSAVSVATGMADVALGTDTGGSVRIPAACCGVYGLKTTFGLVSLKGVFPMSPKHLDTVGPLAKNIPNLAKGMSLLKPGFDEEYAEARQEKPSGRSIRIGRLYVDGTDPEIDRAIDAALKKSGFRVVRLNKEFKDAWDQAQKDGLTVAVADAWTNDEQYGNKRGVSSVTKATILLGRVEHLTGNYDRALKRKPGWQRTLRRTFDRVDLIALPTLKKLPPPIPRFGGSALFEALTFSLQNTVSFNYSGNPAIAIPVPVEGKEIPVTSLQLVGPRLSEAELLNAGRIVSSKRL
ncbi:amidase/aspartyl-tRNA(Asn)/glutamyl-tRNA(Gln) amidotransferase subunit A [Prosthecobacter fusiformis]|uniref:Amidase/aspartyl-tRNA(Asn)/glutamyl-tRNA(Gln) amidotransferase subunit A n=1 Tax=Prosthecobacter fusiformis TaxID=48464 RepID=A0A4R7SRS9_9BACT|nr:amidase [Prosthecobacter fusiformis]TDU81694.1 amidase/aspartyl-tRNA(Asn)/glutamyl-tRNA(Gln) amidotransferase subunit A [Prosthecobacter fusiformis]